MNLSEDIILNFFKYLSQKENFAISQTNRHFYNIYKQNQEFIYKHLIKRDFIPYYTSESLYKILQYNQKNNVNLFDKSHHFKAYINAIDSKKFKEINWLYQIGINIDAKDKYNMSVLMYVLEFSIPDIINRILDLQPCIHTIDLIYALQCSSPEITNRILDLNPDMDYSVSLIHALESSTPEIINRILDYNPDINSINSDNHMSPLMYALEFSTPEIINRILDLNPDINIKCINYLTPFTL